MCCSAIQCSVASCCRSISPLHVAVGIGDAAGLEHPIVIRSAGRESHGICVEQRDTDDEAGLTTVTSVDFKGNVLDKARRVSPALCPRTGRRASIQARSCETVSDGHNHWACRDEPAIEIVADATEVQANARRRFRSRFRRNS